MIYYVIFILLFILFMCELISGKKFKPLWYFYYIIFCAFLMCFAGLRYDIGIDYVSHERIYANIRSGFVENFSNTNQETGYFILNKIFNSFNVMLLFIAIITLTIKFKIIRDNSIYIYMSLFLYYSLFFIRYDMGLVTQGIAMMFIMYSYKYIIEEKSLKFIITILLASLFHISAIIFLPVYWLARKTYSMKFIIITIIISFFAAFSLVSDQILQYISLIIPRYEAYLNSDASFEISINMFKRLVFLLIFVYTIKKYHGDNKVYNIFLNLYFFGAVIYYVFKPIWILSDRGSVYFSLSEIFLWGIVLHSCKGVIRKGLLVSFVIVPYTLYSLYNFINLNDDVLKATYFNKPYIPYQSIFDK
ncbi:MULTISPECIES: EpsG family protein [Bacillus cereus group]|uniref:EpsG family protein n=1 Tax=Bacillus cereus TaxID=1396 RepID=A0A9X8NWA3_BACCE|nr:MULTISPECIES: EpsG family protein [Bacillus cereus group]MDF9537083.1 EpsG family protein [Bacillus cereus]MDF9583936.1 EpsG family protein [Bacillus cereus]MDG1594171.1 EpsG family protein [Bacillus cereus]OFC75489.1 hypothetical protein BTGOE3_51660 [Bacillus thuringiensis]RWQ75260.1 EpsG family protein [Bacillus cereus]